MCLNIYKQFKFLPKMKKNYFFTLFLLLNVLIIYAQPPTEGGTEFDGVTEHIPVPDSNNINTTTVTNRTIETYFKVDDASSRQVIYEEGAQIHAIVIYIESGYIHAGMYRSSGGAGESIFFRKTISNNTWYHMALVLDNATDMKFYIDGTLQDTRSGAFTVPSHSGNINLGRSDGSLRYPSCATWTSAGSSEYCLDDVTASSSSNNHFAGHIWGFRVWDTVRTQTEINDNKDILITDTSTLPGSDMILFLDADFDSMTYFASDDTYQSTDAVLAINRDELLEDSIKIYINNGLLRIDALASEELKDVLLYSMQGKLIFKKNYDEEINVSDISNGIYIVKLNFKESDKTLQKKIIIY